MGFLLTKILFLLVLAAAGGAAFAYWWFGRHFQDVTLDYARSREEWDAWRRSFEERLAERPGVDLEPLTRHLNAVHAAVSDIDIPVPERPDFTPLHARLDELGRRVADIRSPAAADLAPTAARLTAIEHALFPLQTRLDELAGAVRALRPGPAPEAAAIPAAAEVAPDFAVQAIAAAAAEQDAAAAAADPPVSEAAPAPAVAVRDGSKNLLSHAGHGEPDDLTRIKGVAKVLEQTLHKVGVFYFWQIAEWSPADVEYVDSQLTGFHGRIESDEWVNQASELAELPTATPRPREH